MLTSFWSTITSPATTSTAAAAPPDGTGLRQLADRPAGQLRQGERDGTPPVLVVGSGADQRLATLTAGRDMVQLSPIPSNLSTAPASLALSDFEAWPGDIQAYYIRQKGTGTPRSVSIGPAATAVAATLGGDGVAVTLSASAALAASETSLTRAPSIDRPAQFQSSMLSPGAFFGLTADQQSVYIDNINANAATMASAYPAGSSTHDVGDAVYGQLIQHLLVLPGGDSAHTIATTINGATWQIGVPASAYPGFFDPTSLSVGAVSPPRSRVGPLRFRPPMCKGSARPPDRAPPNIRKPSCWRPTRLTA